MEENKLSFSEVIKRLFPFVKPYKKFILISLGLTLIGAVTAQVDPLVLQYLVNEITKVINLGSGFAAGVRVVLISLIILVAEGITILLIDVIQGYLGETIKVRVASELSNTVYKHLLTLDMAFFIAEGNETGKLIRRIDRGVEGLSKVTKNLLIDILPLFATALFGLIVMFSVNVWVGLMASAIVPIYFFLSYKQAKLQEGVRIKIEDLKEKRTQAMFSSLLSIKVIKSFVREKFENAKHEDLNQGLSATEIQHHKTNRKFDSLKLFAEQIGMAAIVVFTSYLILQGQMTVGAILLHLMLFRNVTAPIKHLHRIYDEQNEAITFSYGYFRLLETKSLEPALSITVRDNTPDLIGARDNLNSAGYLLKDVNFGYSPDRLVLKDINIQLKPGETTALVGLSGAGKTTLASLLVRFFEPASGSIFLNGTNILEIPHTYLRQQIGMVLQDNFIFDGTIVDNIKYGKLDADLDAVITAATKAQLHNYIASLPQGYETPASHLSGGQKQRIALARIFLKDPPILILDEPTASLDAITTERIKRALDMILKNRTSLIISHNISQIINADKIYVIKEGRIIEAGTHDSLYTEGGHYSEIIDSNIENLNVLKLIKNINQKQAMTLD